MKVAILNDTHCGIRNSSDIFLDNAEKFFTDVFFPYLMENGISHIVHLGDYFDNRKFINFRALNRNRQFFLAKLREIGYKTFSPWINESYDEEVDNDKRFFMILDEIKRLCSMSKEEIHKW